MQLGKNFFPVGWILYFSWEILFYLLLYEYTV